MKRVTMICQCPSCDQSYELADEQVTGKSVILSCPPCNTSWIVGPVVQSSAPAYADPTDQMGAVDDDDATGAHYRGKSSFPPAPSYAAPQSYMPPAPSYMPPAPSYMPPAQSAAPPARMPELFMTSEQPPQSEPQDTPVTPSARRILRGEAREQRDLFATPVPTPAASVPPPPPSSASPSMFPGSGTAARGEHSLLFSVEELKKAATMRPPPPTPMAVFQNGQRMGQSDEHGVIDLKPMLAAGGAMKSRTEPLYTPANEIHPLGFALSVPPEKKTPVAVFAAAAVAAVLFLAVGLGFALRGGSDEPTAANIRQPVSVAAAAPAADTPSTSTISPDTKIALADKSSKSDSKSDTADAVSPMKPQMVSSKVNAKVYSASSPNRSWKSSSKASSNFTPKSSAPPSPPKAKGGKKSSSDPCGCGGNLACAMKCGL